MAHGWCWRSRTQGLNVEPSCSKLSVPRDMVNRTKSSMALWRNANIEQFVLDDMSSALGLGWARCQAPPKMAPVLASREVGPCYAWLSLAPWRNQESWRSSSATARSSVLMTV